MFLDTLAMRWLQRRYDQACEHLPAEYKEIGLKKVEMTHEGKFEGTFVTPAAAIIAEEMGMMLDEAKAENFVEFTMMPRMDRRKRPIRVTVQWVGGLSPAQTASMLALRVENLRQALEEISDKLSSLAHALPERVDVELLDLQFHVDSWLNEDTKRAKNG